MFGGFDQEVEPFEAAVEGDADGGALMVTQPAAPRGRDGRNKA